MQNNMYDLTNPQKSIWYTEELYKGTPIENIIGTVIIKEKVDFSLLEQAINIYVEKNDSFRTKFTINGNHPQQYIEPYSKFPVEIIDIDSMQSLKSFEKDISLKVFNSLDSILFNFKIVRFSDMHGGFIISMHHLISDAWSAGLGASEIIKIYTYLLNKKNIDDIIYPSYKDYIAAETTYINSDKFIKDKAFWTDYFREIPEVATIPSSNTTSSSDLIGKSLRKQFTLPKELMEKINNYCKSAKCSVFNFFMSIFAIYISRVSGLDEFVIGSPILNRSNIKEKHTSGMFISTVPLKINLKQNIEFKTLVANIGTDFFSIFKHQKYPYLSILEDLRKVDSKIPNLYNILISYQNIRSTASTSNIPYEVTWIPSQYIADDIDIHIYDMNNSGNLNIAYDYQTSKYSVQNIMDIHERILYIIAQVLGNDSILINNIEVVTPIEKKQILNFFNNTASDYPKDKTIIELFEEQVKNCPNNIAVVSGTSSFSYRQIDEHANRLANYLLEQGISENTNIGIFTNRSIESIIGILAILKLNCTYVPIDPSYPIDRIKYMIETSKINFVLYATTLPILLDNLKLIDISMTKYAIFPISLDKKFVYNPNNNLYIIFTSGSTGKPKGVCVSHRNMANLIYFEINKTNILNGNCNILQFATMSFDVSYQEIFSALLTGNTLILISDDIRKNSHTLSKYIIENKINTLFIPPAYLKLLSSDDKIVNELSLCVKNIITAGEKLVLTNGIQELLNKGIKIHNHYGPAETHVATAFTVDSLKYGIEPPIGQPISNAQIFILDKKNQLCPNSVVGQIAIGGDCVGNGYLNNTELTNEKFIHLPFTKTKVYLTGDLGYYSTNGLIYYVGRNDFQVKINGFRIEVEEVEKAINSYSEINNSTVIPMQIKNSQYSLVAYFVSNSKISTKDLKAYLQTRLPNYMVPSYLIQLDKLPYTINGKIDRKALPLPDFNTRKIIKKARNNSDEKLIKILKNVLNVSNISIGDSFFELGGDSLSCINLCAQIQNEFNVTLFVKDILENPIISNISDIIVKKAICTKKVTIQPSIKSEYYPTSSAQKRIFLSSSIAGNSSTLYNIPGGIIFDKMPDFEKLENCLKSLILRHEALRTHFEIINNTIVQKISDNIEFNLDFSKDIISYDALKQEFNHFIRPFDLSAEPLFRAKFFRLTDNRAALLVDMHHIISDGTSLQIIIKELCALYNNQHLEKNNLSYKDYSVWENNSLLSGSFKEAEDYWVSQFKNDIPVLEMPTTFSRPAVQSFAGRKLFFEADSTLRSKIETTSRELGITPYMFTLAAYYILLYNYSSQSDIVVGSPIVGRNLPETQDIVGMFVNTLPIRILIDSKQSFKDFLASIKELCLNNYKYQSYPFDELVNKLNIKRDVSRSPIFDTLFTFQNTQTAKINFNGINAEIFSNDYNISKFDLSLEIIPTSNEFAMNFEYCTKLFDRKFVENLSKHYINILKVVTDNINVKISNIDMMSKDEKNILLNEFNNNLLDYPRASNVKELFEATVNTVPNNIATVDGMLDLTYKELNDKANSLSNFLIKKGVQKGDIIPVIMNKSTNLIISMFAIIKSGAVYLPVSAEYPQERVDYILKNCNAKFALTTTNTNLISDDSIEPIFIDNFDFNKNSHQNPDISISPTDTLYIIYTSGSTGNPKGARISHRNLINLVSSFTNSFNGINSTDNCLSSTNMSFDVSIWEFFITLLNGASLYIYEENSINDIFKFCKAILKYNITLLYIPPNILESVYSVLSTYSYIPINKLLLGVEPIGTATIRKYITLKPEMRIVNGYGPTETTICATSCIVDNHILKDYRVIPLGKPIHNSSIYILNKNLSLAPVNVPGEIYVAGDGVGKGYLNNKELTDKAFVELPSINCKRAYKTGDLAKWNEDGTISFIGRKDFQVKVNGHRIELGEIEACIYQYPNIDKVVVLLDDSKRIVAFFSSEKSININDLRAFVQRKLPSYFIPNFFVQVEKFKLTGNGKVDMKALRKVKFNTSANYEPPHTKYQTELVNIFKNILNLEKVGINDNFFELGGDSLTAIKLQIEAFNKGLELSYKDIFTYPTIKQLSENVSKTSEPVLEKDYDYTNIDNLIKNNTMSSNLILKKDKVKNILLTGATGYIGSHILDNLLKHTKCNVYCLIRAKNNNDPQTRLLDVLRFYFGPKYDKYIFKRIFAIEGDITENNLGMSDMYYEELGKNISCVINSAAIVKHYGNSDIFNNTNISGTQNIINFCTKFNCKLMHLSTLSVSRKYI